MNHFLRIKRLFAHYTYLPSHKKRGGSARQPRPGWGGAARSGRRPLRAGGVSTGTLLLPLPLLTPARTLWSTGVCRDSIYSHSRSCSLQFSFL
ncbi:hypothetical protein JYU34_012222 [Plutella xylostella]|uniref:Uncharacterized protein n=1 Tax=Plutella xylostella TaxID=51655 RepID=A0ABQ7QEM6_PLUXY|nr:hypothetical protein JYU34_012222 [Plutella xylostella]